VLQNKIDEIKPYFRSLETYNDALIVRVQFPNKWAVFPSDDGKIKPAPSSQVANEYFYYGDGKDVSLEDIFDFVKETIEVNQSLEIKAKLLVERAKELQELFETTPLEKLKTLKFVMEDVKKNKPKRKYTKKKKIEPEAKELAENKSNHEDEDTVKVTEEVCTKTDSNDSEIKISSATLDKFKKYKKEKNS